MSLEKQRIYDSKKYKSIDFYIFIGMYVFIIKNFFDKSITSYVASDVFFMALYIIGIIVVSVCLYRMFFSKKDTAQLIITDESISAHGQLTLPWTKNLTVLQITDFKNSTLAKTNDFFWDVFDTETAFLIVEKNTDGSHGTQRMIIDTRQWGIDDIEDLTMFFAEVGYPVEAVSAEYVNKQYFYQSLDIGNKAGTACVLAIVFMVVAMGFSLNDQYRTIDYGVWWYIGWLCFIVSTIACFYVIRTVKKLWIIQLIPALLFAFTTTCMMIMTISCVSQWTGTKERVEFRYVDEHSTKGVRWQHTGNPDVMSNCGDPQQADKDNNQHTTRHATLLKTLGMVRVNNIELCQ